MMLRSLLFVPADRPERFDKAAHSGADAIIIDLEDSVVHAKKAEAREAAAQYLAQPRELPIVVRINPLGSAEIAADLAAILPAKPDAIMLPKAEGAASINAMLAQMDKSLLSKCDIPILPIATETPAVIFELGSYRQVADSLFGLTWGAEDLPAAIGASTSREEDGSFTPPYELARSLTLFAAHAAKTHAIETVYPDIRDLVGLTRYAARGRRDGFTGMMAIHPAQVEIINKAFTPSEAELEQARIIVEAFTAQPEIGALQLNGKMVDRPHLLQAQKLLKSAGV